MEDTLRIRADRHIYIWAALGCALLAAMGFARTYYLRGLFGSPPLPLLLHVHGIIMSAWCVLFVLQASLVAAHRVDLHRRLGIFGAAFAIVVVMLGAYVTINATAREVQAHVNGQFHMLFGFNLLNLLVFLILFGAALAQRSKSTVHKRLMLLATISLLPPAIARATLLFTDNQAAQMWAVNIVVLVCVVGDAIVHRRMHPTFAWGAALLLIPLNLGYVLFQTAGWTAFVTQLFS